jgi:hypothetical protein
LELSADEEASFDASLAQAEQGEFPTDDQIRAFARQKSGTSDNRPVRPCIVAPGVATVIAVCAHQEPEYQSHCVSVAIRTLAPPAV